jgi:hypothetical protein
MANAWGNAWGGDTGAWLTAWGGDGGGEDGPGDAADSSDRGSRMLGFTSSMVRGLRIIVFFLLGAL